MQFSYYSYIGEVWVTVTDIHLLFHRLHFHRLLFHHFLHLLCGLLHFHCKLLLLPLQQCLTSRLALMVCYVFQGYPFGLFDPDEKPRLRDQLPTVGTHGDELYPRQQAGDWKTVLAVYLLPLIFHPDVEKTLQRVRKEGYGQTYRYN